MRVLLAMGLIVLSQLPPKGRTAERASDVNLRRTDRGLYKPTHSTPQFQFAPPTNAGMGAPCAGTFPTSMNGIPSTMVDRGNVRYCNKATTITNIQNGDVVELTSSQPVIEPGFDGTNILGYSCWDARVNYTLYSQEIDNAAWLKVGVVAAAPTVTADYAVSPDGTQNAERVQIAATGATDVSIVSNLCHSTATVANGIFVRGCPVLSDGGCSTDGGTGADGGTGGGVIDVGIARGTPATYLNTACTYNAAGWTWCRNTGGAVIGAGGLQYVGNDGLANGGVARTASDVFLWQGDCQDGVDLGPPIKTAGVAVTRAKDLALKIPFNSGSSSLVSTAATALIGADVANSRRFVYWDDDALAKDGGIAPLLRIGESTTQRAVTTTFIDNTTSSVKISVGTFPLGASSRFAGYSNTSVVGICINGVCETAALGAPLATVQNLSIIWIGAGPNGLQQANGIVKQVCVDTTDTRCR